MIKRTKLMFLISTLCLCLSLLLVGIYATTSIMFSVTSSLKYSPSTPQIPIDFVKWKPDDPSTTDVANDGYYYLEMGELSDGTPLEWRLVLERTGSEDDPTDSTVDGVIDDNFTGNKQELEGKTYYFLLNTWTGGTSSTDSPDACSFDNYCTFSSRNFYDLDYAINTVPAIDYASSTIRQYITGTPVLRGYNDSGSSCFPVAHTESGQTENTPDDFLSKYSIDTDPLYSFIEGRSLSDLYKKISSDSYENPMDVSYNSTVATGDSDTAGIPETTEDKLWILSYYEAYEITEDYSSSNAGARKWNGHYWLRSYALNLLITYACVGSNGILTSISDTFTTLIARPAFQMSF